MTNRLKDFFGQPEEYNDPAEDYYLVSYRFQDFHVTGEVAECIVRALESDRPPRWLRFRDIHGSHVNVRSRMIEYVRECTTTQRTSERTFDRARRKEDKADRRPWEDDD